MTDRFFDLAEVLTGATIDGVYERDPEQWGTHDLRLTLSNGDRVIIRSVGSRLEISHETTENPATDRRPGS